MKIKHIVNFITKQCNLESLSDLVFVPWSNRKVSTMFTLKKKSSRPWRFIMSKIFMTSFKLVTLNSKNFKAACNNKKHIIVWSQQNVTSSLRFVLKTWGYSFCQTQCLTNIVSQSVAYIANLVGNDNMNILRQVLWNVLAVLCQKSLTQVSNVTSFTSVKLPPPKHNFNFSSFPFTKISLAVN